MTLVDRTKFLNLQLPSNCCCTTVVDDVMVGWMFDMTTLHTHVIYCLIIVSTIIAYRLIIVQRSFEDDHQNNIAEHAQKPSP